MDQPFWRGAFSGIDGTAIAAGIAFFLLTPSFTNPLLEDLVSAHVGLVRLLQELATRDAR
jgi:hypothetical protein